METENIITSAQNPKVKRLLALQQKSSERREAGLFVVEGRRELERCLAAGFEVQTVFWSRPTPLPLPVMEGSRQTSRESGIEKDFVFEDWLTHIHCYVFNYVVDNVQMKNLDTR